MKKKSFFIFSIFLIYTALSIFGMLSHELSLDEAHHWLLARDSISISDLIHNSRYDGHPILWDLLLHFISLLSKNVFAMQFFQLIISCTATFLFLRYAPFSLLQKTLIIFGYFFFFEYNIICRSYGLSWLLLVILCILFSSEKRNSFSIVMILILLANTHLFSLICTVPLFILLIKNIFQEKRSKIYLSGIIAFYFIGIGLSFWMMVPPADSVFAELSVHDHHFSFQRILSAFSFFLKGMFCLPDFSLFNFWNTNYFISHLKLISFISFFIAFTLPLFCFNKLNSLFIFYFSTSAIVITLYLLNFTVGTHYMGYCFMLFLISFWLDKNYKIDPYVLPALKYKTLIGNSIFAFILILQTFSGITAMYLDHQFAFSEGKNVAAYLRSDPALQNEEVIVMPFNAGPSIAAYLDKKIYYPETDHYGSFCNWNTHLLREKESIVEKIDQTLNGMTKNNIALVLAYPKEQITYIENSLAFDPHFYYSIKSEMTYNNSISPNGNYTVLRFEHLKK